MADISILNAMGDAVLGAAVLYSAYQVRNHPKIATFYALLAAVFFTSAIVFARQLVLFEFYAVMTLRMFLFAVLFVEIMKYMVKEFEKIRIAYLLYASLIVFAFTTTLDVITVYSTVFVVSQLILITAFSFLLAVKSGHTRFFTFLGLLGVLFNFGLLATEVSIIFAPWKVLFIPGRALLIVFFIGFAYHVRCNPYRFYDRHRVLFKRKKRRRR